MEPKRSLGVLSQSFTGYPLLSSLLLRDGVRVQGVWRPGEKGEMKPRGWDSKELNFLSCGMSYLPSRQWAWTGSVHPVILDSRSHYLNIAVAAGETWVWDHPIGFVSLHWQRLCLNQGSLGSGEKNIAHIPNSPSYLSSKYIIHSAAIHWDLSVCKLCSKCLAVMISLTGSLTIQF